MIRFKKVSNYMFYLNIIIIYSCNNKEIKTIDEGNNFKVVDESTDIKSIYKYYIYDSNKNIVFEDTNERTVPQMKYIDEDTLQIGINAGTGVFICRYYDVKNNVFSDYFDTPSAIYNRKIAYMNIVNDKIVLIVQDIFDRHKLYKEFERDFTPTGVPTSDLIETKFIDDSQVKITYLSGEHAVEKEETLNLNIN